MTYPDPLDRRQRVAAALLLLAVDLPMDMERYGRLMQEACRACPGMTMGDFPDSSHDRRTILRHARNLISDMLDEMNEAREATAPVLAGTPAGDQPAARATARPQRLREDIAAADAAAENDESELLETYERDEEEAIAADQDADTAPEFTEQDLLP